MPSRLKALLASLAVTAVIGAGAFLVALVTSVSGGGADGIGAYAGGVSRRFVGVTLLALPAVFVALFFIFRRAFR